MRTRIWRTTRRLSVAYAERLLLVWILGFIIVTALAPSLPIGVGRGLNGLAVVCVWLGLRYRFADELGLPGPLTRHYRPGLVSTAAVLLGVAGALLIYWSGGQTGVWFVLGEDGG